jgi:hypothetical protein
MVREVEEMVSEVCVKAVDVSTLDAPVWGCFSFLLGAQGGIRKKNPCATEGLHWRSVRGRWRSMHRVEAAWEPHGDHTQRLKH